MLCRRQVSLKAKRSLLRDCALRMPKITRSCGTHDGTFHADEVTACALLVLFDLIDEDKIHRTRDPKVLADCDFVCDVGGVYDPSQRLFDHHQADYSGPMSSAGMILLYLKDQEIIDKDTYGLLNQSLVLGVDAHDNGKAPQIEGFCTFSHLVSNFTPVRYDTGPEEQNAAFHEALTFVLGHLKRLLGRFEYIRSCREAVDQAMLAGRDCLHFDKAMPWLESFFELGGEEHPALFVIMPSGDHWKLRGIPPSYKDRMRVRVPLPQHWAGLLENELRDVAGIQGAIFCHKERFISVWETREDAEKAFEYIMQTARRER